MEAWIETHSITVYHWLSRRFLHWKRGLKHLTVDGDYPDKGSLPSLEAWIETAPGASASSGMTSLPSLEAWIETRLAHYSHIETACRFLHWKRGLKQYGFEQGCARVMSLPSLEAWIETSRSSSISPTKKSRFLHWKRGLKLRQRSQLHR